MPTRVCASEVVLDCLKARACPDAQSASLRKLQGIMAGWSTCHAPVPYSQAKP